MAPLASGIQHSTLCLQGHKIGCGFLTKKVVVKDKEVGDVKASKVINVERKPFSKDFGANQHTHNLNEDSIICQEDPFFWRQPHQKRKQPI